MLTCPVPAEQTHLPAPDPELIASCLAGDPTCFRQLYQRHQARVRSIIFGLCGASHLDDLVQEVFIRAWKGLPKFRRDAQFSTWLYRIAWNVASTHRQTLARQRRQIQTLEQTLPHQQEAPTTLEFHYQAIVQRSLQALSPVHRDILVLHDLQELPQKEIAQILGIPIGTVKSRLFHARSNLRNILHRAGIESL